MSFRIVYLCNTFRFLSPQRQIHVFVLLHPGSHRTMVGKLRSSSLVSVFLDPCDPGLSLSPGRSVMAEPDYLEGDCDELIKPKKLINPVKNSRNHQDLHRELLMNQKRSGESFTVSSSCVSSVSL